MRWLRLGILLSGIAVVSASAPPPRPLGKEIAPPLPRVVAPTPAKDQLIRPHATPDSGVREALRDTAFDFFGDGPHLRYIWIDNTDEESFKAVLVTLAYISRASHPLHFEALSGPLSLVVRVDLRDLFPGDRNLEEGRIAWEDFRFDPSFNLLLTPDAVELSPFSANMPAEVKNGQTLRFNAPDLNQKNYEDLKAVTRSQAPIVEYRYFIMRTLSTIRDDGPYRDIFGGLYNQLRGIKGASEEQKKKGIKDIDVVLASLGIGNLEAGENFEKFLDRIRGDLRPAMFISDVTGSPRAIILTHTAAEREGGSWGGFSLDLKRKSIDVRQHPVLSQLRPKIDAIELIFVGPNGMPIFALFQGFDDKGVFQGKLLEKADSDVVADRTVPSPHSTDLQAAIGCIRCHGPEQTWKPLIDVLAGLLEKDRIRILRDLQFSDEIDAQDRILGLHSVIPGRVPGPRTRQSKILDKLLQRQRDDFTQVIAEVTGPWASLAGKQETVGSASSAKISSVYGQYWYDPVDARSVLLDVGLDVPAERAANVMTLLLAEEGQPVLGAPYESVRLAELAAGGKIGRVDWSLERSFAAGRINQAVAKLLAEQKGKP